jgi:NADPH-dependent 2,4-dienoyl-CoA reductase/sulfur reductase-like enzyme
MEQFDLLVVGGGAGGMAAALAACETGHRVALAEQTGQLGGVLCQCLHRGFGRGYFGEDLTGPEYAARFTQRMARSPVTVWCNTAVVALHPDQTALLAGPGQVRRVGFKTCILAAGCRETPIGALPVSGTRPAGIFTAGQAQQLVNLGHYALGREIVILGSGDIGQIMARQLTLQGGRIVAMVEKRDTPGGLLRNRRECLQAFHIPLLLRSTVAEIRGSGRIQSVVVRQIDTGAQTELRCDTLITALGLIPDQTLAEELKKTGRLPDWLYLCGNCDTVHEIVDSVTWQALEIGRKCLKGEKNDG